MIKAVIFATLTAAVLGSYHDPGFAVTHKGVVADYNNARRQQAVNTVAHSIGRGTGTAYKDGVPGAGEVYLHNYGQHAYGYGGPYGYDGYGKGGYGGYGGRGYGGYRAPNRYAGFTRLGYGGYGGYGGYDGLYH